MTREQAMRILTYSKTAAVVGTLMLAGVAISACVERAKEPGNELPQGYVDAPKPGDVLQPGKTRVGGWALDDSGVAEVRIYFDGRYKASARLNVARPDVGRIHPRYARRGDIYGWNLNVDFGTSPGTHTIVVQAVDDNGATCDIGIVPVVIPGQQPPGR
jgi:hypothetical protein